MSYNFKFIKFTMNTKKIYLLLILLISTIILSCSDANDKLFEAIRENDIETVKAMIDKGMDLNIVNDEGKPAVILAVELKRRRIAEMMLKTSNINCDVRDLTGTSLLMWVCKNSGLDLFTLVIDRGVQLNEQNEDGMTPLMFASQSSYYDATMPLIQKKVYINAQNKDGNTALMLALKSQADPVVRLLRDNKSLLNLQNNDGETPLIIAAEEGLIESIKLLLEYKADKTIKDKKGRTALSIAKEKGFSQIAELLSEDNSK